VVRNEEGEENENEEETSDVYPELARRGEKKRKEGVCSTSVYVGWIHSQQKAYTHTHCKHIGHKTWEKILHAS
jgi:hypothetical protein